MRGAIFNDLVEHKRILEKTLMLPQLCGECKKLIRESVVIIDEEIEKLANQGDKL